MVLLFLGHWLATWGLLALAGEHTLVGLDAFPYYYMTTATTIGYGDLSPGTVAGRYIVAFWQMPGSVALFATILAKTSASLITFWRRHQMGKMSYAHLRGHTLLVGWRGPESVRLVELLLSDTATDDEGLVLVAEGLAENPLPDHMRFVAVDSYTLADGCQRAGIAGAARVIVNPPSDDQTLAAVFGAMANRPQAHVVAHFDSARSAELVRRHSPQVECTRPLSAEIIARAAQDPGSAALTADLLSAGSGPTQFSPTVPAESAALHYGRVGDAFRARGALLPGHRDAAAVPRLNPAPDSVLAPGTMLYYLAERRVDSAAIAWADAALPAPAHAAAPSTAYAESRA
ncbi:potassium channel family protein [Xanthomonas hyacinthi]|uniref:potassium channel family protein n=1 Tax=Xanthomonas hyacinthi TaxID=56455 RepID=UPI000AA91399|nr:ion channel [Xanthomonas hyacinthi]